FADLLGTQRRIREQALAQMREISVRISRRSDPFIDLHHMHGAPWHFFVREITKHEPRSFAAARGHYKLAASRNCIPRLLPNKLRCLAGYGVGIRQDFNLHHAASLATANALLSLGLLQPPGGVTRATSSGPQVLGAYW